MPAAPTDPVWAAFCGACGSVLPLAACALEQHGCAWAKKITYCLSPLDCPELSHPREARTW